MISFAELKDQTLCLRRMMAQQFETLSAHADTIPAGWKNNARWHAGHLVVTPRLLTYGLMGRPLGVAEDYRRWFGKGSAPEGWGTDPVPTYAELVQGLTASMEELFANLEGREDEPFAKPYMTSLGLELRTPAQAINFSQAHDGIHLGLLLALKRSLQG